MAENWLLKLDKPSLDCVKLIGEEAAKFGCRSYLVGGIVRDLILGRSNTDLDIVIEGSAIQLGQRLAKVLKMDIVCFAEFKTAKLFDKKGRHIDLTSSRREFYPKPGALPVVDEGNLQADLFRRDFTMNALAVSLSPDAFGQLVDMYGGLDDLENKRIKVFHDNSFQDDPTRILRAIRFEQRFDFALEANTAVLLKKAVQTKAYKTLSDPRYFAEFRKVLREDDPLKALQRLKALDLLRLAGENLTWNTRSIQQCHQALKKLTEKTSVDLAHHRWIYYFIELLGASTDAKIKRICQKVQLSKELENTLLQSRRYKQILNKLDVKTLTKSGAYFLLRDLDIKAVYYLRLKSTKPSINKLLDLYLSTLCNISLHIDGDDIKKMGSVSGKRIGQVLRAVLARKIDKNLRTKSQEIKAAKEILTER